MEKRISGCETTEAILYSPSDLNYVISMLLSDLVDDEVVDQETAMTAKSVFNNLMDMIVYEKEDVNSLIEIAKELEQDYLDEMEDEEVEFDNKPWDAVEAAEKIRDDTLLS